MDCGRRDEVISFVDCWRSKTGFPAKEFCRWLGISPSKLSVWRKRLGVPCSHSPFVRRGDCLTPAEKEAIVSFYREHYNVGYRRCAYMMIDAGIAAVTPSTVYGVLKRAGALRTKGARRGCKGTGFHQPDRPHRHWHTDITHVKVNGVSANLCSILDGYSRYVVSHKLSENGTALDVELVFQKAVEKFPEARGRVISDNGKPFVCKEYRELLGANGFTCCNTSPYYPQSNGKQERMQGTVKHEFLSYRHLHSFSQAVKVIDQAIDHYNNVRLHGAIGYVTPKDMLEGRAPAIQAERERKIREAREARRLANSDLRTTLVTLRETEGGSAGGQPPRDSGATTTA